LSSLQEKTKQRLKVAASLWSADLTQLKIDVKRIEKYCDFFHFDIMDGHFVPYILFGPAIIEALRPNTDVLFDVHLMVEQPEFFADQVLYSGADMISFHPETSKNPLDLIKKIKNKGKKAGIAIKLDKSIEDYDHLLADVNFVTVMGTEIGIKGADIDPNTYKRIDHLQEIKKRHLYDFEIQADGGIRRHTVPELVKAGADIIVAGSLLFNNNPDEVTTWLNNL
jgi:ribulose-phosphate 3-epimerase